MPFSLCLLVLPICLPAESRTLVCENDRAYFLKIVEESPSMVVAFAERARAFLPFTLEALGLLAELKCIDVTEEGAFRVLPRKISAQFQGTEETSACERAATLIGRHFGRIRDRATIYSALRIRP
jgi:CRP-like cAMP-binding protein